MIGFAPSNFGQTAEAGPADPTDRRNSTGGVSKSYRRGDGGLCNSLIMIL